MQHCCPTQMLQVDEVCERTQHAFGHSFACRPVADSNIMSKNAAAKAVPPASRPLTTSQAYGQYAAASMQAKGLNGSSTASTGTPARAPVNSRAVGYENSIISDAVAARVAGNVDRVKGTLFGPSVATEPAASRAALTTNTGPPAYSSYAPAAGLNARTPALVDAWSPPCPLPAADNLDLGSASLWQPSKAEPAVERVRAWEATSSTEPYPSQAALGYSSAHGPGAAAASNGMGAVGSSYSGSYTQGQPAAPDIVTGLSVADAAAAAANASAAGMAAGSPGSKPGGTPYATERTLKVQTLHEVLRAE
jgi:hypothetical protein